jgi:hypothetical protein
MTAAPSPILKWAAALGLPEELIGALAPWLGRLSLAVGPRAASLDAGRGEPDGVAGLTRRGDYERLLLSEWLLADELPDEFLRRAASGEHVFVARARRLPPARRRTLALFSAGPAQLGAPRLAHLAALLVLARRAAQAGAVLRWGVLERPGDGAHDGADLDGVRRLLLARTATTLTPAAIDAWLAAEPPAARDDDVWVVGGGDVVEPAARWRAGTIVVRERVDPAVRALDVEVRRGAARNVRLDLPTADACARLLRDPIARPAAGHVAPTGAPAVRGLWFLPGDRKLVLDRGSRLEIWPVPGSPHEPAGNPRTVEVPPGEELVAVGSRRRAPIRVTRRDDDPTRLWLRDPGVARGKVEIIVPLPHREAAADAPGRIGPSTGLRTGLCLHVPTPAGRRLVMHVPPGRILQADLSQEPARAVDVSADDDPRSLEVVAFAPMDDGLVYAQVRGDRVQLQRLTPHGIERLATVPRQDPDLDPTVRFGPRLGQGTGWGPVAVRVTERTWSVLHKDGVFALEHDGPVHGAAIVHGKPALVIAEADGRQLALLGGGGRTIPRAGGLITAVACGTRLPSVAWVTAAGDVVVYSLQHERVLLRVIQEDA